jgi:hypothetical protein
VGDALVRYYAMDTKSWGMTIRDRTVQRDTMVPRGETPKKHDAIVATWVKRSLVQTMVDALNAKDASDA